MHRQVSPKYSARLLTVAFLIVFIVCVSAMSKVVKASDVVSVAQVAGSDNLSPLQDEEQLHLPLISAGAVSTSYAYIKVTPTSLLLTDVNQSFRLTAQVYDEVGMPSTKSVTWTSSHPEHIEVDANGNVTSVSGLGSALIYAEVDGTTSAPVGVVIAPPIPGAQLLNDRQVIGQPEFISEDVTPEVGMQFRVTLQDVSGLTPGTIVIAPGDSSFGGRIVSVTPSGNSIQATLEIVPTTQLFQQVEIDERFSIGDFVPPPLPASTTTVSAVNIASPSAADALDCETDGEGFKLTAFDIDLDTTNVFINLAYQNNQLRAYADGVLIVTVTSQFELGNFGLECKFGASPFPFLVSPYYALGIGIEAKAEVKQVAHLDKRDKQLVNLKVGVDCINADDKCQWFNEFEVQPAENDTLIDLPSVENTRIKGSIFVFGLMRIGMRIALKEVGLVDFRAGVELGIDLALIEAQANEKEYASTYDARLRGGLGISPDFQKAYRFLTGNAQFVDVELVLLDQLLAQSPIGTISTDASSFTPGTLIKYKVNFNPDFLEFGPFGYNVKNVLIYRLQDDQLELMETLSAKEGQNEFEWNWEPDENAGCQATFVAFVETKLLPFIPLEIGENSQTLLANLACSKIAFVSGRNGPEQIFLMNADGSNPTQLTTGGGYDPAWSPDGTKIAFTKDVSYGDFGDQDIFIMNADGSSPINVTSSPGYSERQPTWSPDGSQIAFSSLDNWIILVMNADGSNIRPLTSPPVHSYDSNPSWSPDGTQIIFDRESYFPSAPDDENHQIYIVDADGGVAQNLTPGVAWSQNPAWSPDGSKITFLGIGGDGTGGRDIFVMDASGGSRIRLTNTEYWEEDPSWSPDGTQIAFSGFRPPMVGDFNNNSIYVIDADGTHETRITDVPIGNYDDSAPQWQPLPSQD